MDKTSQAELCHLPPGFKAKLGDNKPKPVKTKKKQQTAVLKPQLATLLFSPRPTAVRDESAGASNLYFDYETYSEADISTCGLDNYARHPSTKPLIIGWAFDDYPAQVVDLTCTEFPPFLLAAFSNPAIKKIAWNASFERAITLHCLGIEIPLSDVFDPSDMARKLTFPGKLELACEAAGLSVDEAKDKDGTRLISMFSKPSRMLKK